jgi:hypothetical protein
LEVVMFLACLYLDSTVSLAGSWFLICE